MYRIFIAFMRTGQTLVSAPPSQSHAPTSWVTPQASVFWQRLRQLQEENMTVTVKVDSANRGGLLVKYGPYDGFVPVSQFGPQINPDTMETMVGSDLPVQFLEVDEVSGKFHMHAC